MIKMMSIGWKWLDTDKKQFYGNCLHTYQPDTSEEVDKLCERFKCEFSREVWNLFHILEIEPEQAAKKLKNEVQFISKFNLFLRPNYYPLPEYAWNQTIGPVKSTATHDPLSQIIHESGEEITLFGTKYLVTKDIHEFEPLDKCLQKIIEVDLKSWNLYGMEATACHLTPEAKSVPP